MLWSGARYAGFSNTEPWLPISPDWRSLTTARQVETEGSILRFYKALIALRRRTSGLWEGRYKPLWADQGLLAYERASCSSRVVVVLDLAGEGGLFELGEGRVALSTRGGRIGEKVGGRLRLEPNEGVIVDLA